MAYNPAYINFDLNPFDEAAEAAKAKGAFSDRVNAGYEAMTSSGPMITRPPQDVTAAAGSTAQFTVTAIGEGTLTYQWQWKNSTGVWTNSSSATQGYNTDTLSVSATTTRNGYQYRCVVTDGSSRKTVSAAATLTVT